MYRPSKNCAKSSDDRSMSRSSGLEDKPESARIKNERSNGLDTEYSSGLVNFIGSFDTRKRAITAPPTRRTPGVRIGNNPAESPVPRPARNTHCNKRPHGLPCTYRAYSGTDTGRPWLSLYCTALALLYCFGTGGSWNASARYY